MQLEVGGEGRLRKVDQARISECKCICVSHIQPPACSSTHEGIPLGEGRPLAGLRQDFSGVMEDIRRLFAIWEPWVRLQGCQSRPSSVRIIIDGPLKDSRVPLGVGREE